MQLQLFWLMWFFATVLVILMSACTSYYITLLKQFYGIWSSCQVTLILKVKLKFWNCMACRTKSLKIQCEITTYAKGHTKPCWTNNISKSRIYQKTNGMNFVYNEISPKLTSFKRPLASIYNATIPQATAFKLHFFDDIIWYPVAAPGFSRLRASTLEFRAKLLFGKIFTESYMKIRSRWGVRDSRLISMRLIVSTSFSHDKLGGILIWIRAVTSLFGNVTKSKHYCLFSCSVPDNSLQLVYRD